MTPEAVLVTHVPLARLSESPLNPRQHYDPIRLQELADNIAVHGIRSPLLVRPWPRNEGRYEIAAGHRRFRAAQQAHQATVPVLVREMDDTTFLEILTFENLQHEDLHPLEEAAGYRMLQEQLKYDAPTIALRVGKDPSYVHRRLKLLNLCPEAREAFLAEQLTISHALLLAPLQPKEQQDVMQRLQSFTWERSRQVPNEYRSAREMKDYIEHNILLELKSAPFNKKDAMLLPAAGSCQDCPKRTGFVPELFPDIKKKDICTDPACFDAKRGAHVEKIKAEWAAKGTSLLELNGEYGRGGTGLARDKWTEIHAKTNFCSSRSSGIFVCGDRLGEIIDVCADLTCKRHHAFHDDRGNAQTREKADDAKRKKKIALNEELFAQVWAAVQWPLPEDVLRTVAIRSYQRLWWESKKRVAKRYGLENGRAAVEERIIDVIENMAPSALAAFLVECAMVDDVKVSYADQKTPMLDRLVTIYEVDREAIKTTLAAAAREKKKPAKTKKKTAKAASQPAERTCRSCGCGDLTPCPGGCSWVAKDLCSACS